MSGRRTNRVGIGPQGGFTLIELLIALVLMALIAVLLVAALGGAKSGLAHLDDTPESAAVEMIQSHLRQVLSQVRPIRLPGLAPEAPIIVAQPDRMRFISSFSTPAEYAGLYQVDLEVRPEGASGLWSLVEIRNLYRPASQSASPPWSRGPGTTVLLTGLTSVELTYFGPRTENGEAKPAAWYPSWTDTAVLPRLVGLRLAFKDPARRTWQPLIVELVASR